SCDAGYSECFCTDGSVSYRWLTEVIVACICSGDGITGYSYHVCSNVPGGKCSCWAASKRYIITSYFTTEYTCAGKCDHVVIAVIYFTISGYTCYSQCFCTDGS